MTAAQKQVVTAYRNLFKAGLRAIQYSRPSRYTLQHRLRHVFRNGSLDDFNQTRINNTLEFLNGAARVRGIEHRIVKGLMLVWFHEDHQRIARLKDMYVDL